MITAVFWLLWAFVVGLVIGSYASWWLWVHAARSVTVRAEPQPLTSSDYDDRKLEELLQGVSEAGPKPGEKLH